MINIENLTIEEKATLMAAIIRSEVVAAIDEHGVLHRIKDLSIASSPLIPTKGISLGIESIADLKTNSVNYN